MGSQTPAARWAAVGWGFGIALGCAAVVRALRPERSAIEVAVTAATPWLLAPSWALLIGCKPRLVALAGALAGYHAVCTRPRLEPQTSDFPGGVGPQLRVALAKRVVPQPYVPGVLGELVAGEHDVVALVEVTHDHLAAIEELPPRRRTHGAGTPRRRGRAPRAAAW